MSNIINLIKLSFNNFLSIKKTVMISIICFSVAAAANSTFSIMLIGMITYVIAYQTMAYEDSYGINYLISYLPVTKKEFILSRYLFNLVMMVIACLYYTVLYLLSKQFNIAQVSGVNLDYKTILYAGIFVSVLLISVCIPLLLKYGIVKGRTMMTVVFMAIIFIPSFVFVNGPSNEIMSLAEKVASISGDLLLFIVSIICLSISYIITCKIYNKKELLA